MADSHSDNSDADPSAEMHVTIRHERYRLDDLVSTELGHESWRGYDLVLNRIVGLQIINRSHRYFPLIHQAALKAGQVVDRRIVQVIDVVLDADDMIIVSEWMDGSPLDEIHAAPMSAQQSTKLAQEVALAVSALNRHNVNHGRIGPSCIVLNRNGEVRLRGHVILAALIGNTNQEVARELDISAVGASLVAGLTNTWRGPIESRMNQSPVHNGEFLAPSQIRASLPRQIDEFVARTDIGPNQFRSIDDVMLGLVNAQHVLPPDYDIDQPAQAHGRSKAATAFRRTGGIIIGIAATAVVASAGIGIIMISGNQASDSAQAGEPPRSSTSQSQIETPIPQTSDSEPASVEERELPIASAWGREEVGKHLSSTPEGALIHDGDISSSWKTPVYRTSKVSKKSFDSLIVDLGSEQPVKAIDLQLIGEDSDIVITLGKNPKFPVAKKNMFADVSSAPSSLVVRKARPVTTRYIAITFTKVPPGVDGFQGGIGSLKVRGQ